MADSENKKDKFVKPLDFSAGNLASAWKVFKDQFAVYKIVKKLDELSADEQIAHMLMAMGSESIPVYNQFVFVDSDANKKKTLVNCIKMFDTYFEPVKNVIFERSVFNKMVQESGQSLHQFIVKLQVQSENCEYGTMKDDLVRDRIVVGVRDIELRKYLIDVPDLTLRTCIQKAKQYVSNQQQVAEMGPSTPSAKDEDSATNVDQVTSRKKEQKGKPDYGRKDSSLTAAKSTDKACPKCGKWKHFGGKCPAERSKCNKCKQFGHWAKMCSSRKQVSEVQEELEDDMDSMGLYLGSCPL